MINEANEPSSACRLWRVHLVETSTPPSSSSIFVEIVRGVKGVGGLAGGQAGKCGNDVRPAGVSEAVGLIASEKFFPHNECLPCTLLAGK